MSYNIVIRPQTQHKKTTYQVEWYEGTRRRRKNFKTESEAIGKERSLIAKHRRDTAIEELKTQGIKFGVNQPQDGLVRKEIQDAMGDFYRAKEARALDPKDKNSLKIEKLAYNLFGEFVIDQQDRCYCDEITLLDLEKFRESLQSKGLKNATVKRKENSVKAFLNYCLNHKYVSENVASKMGKILVITPKRELYSEDQKQKLVSKLAEWVQEFFVVLEETFGVYIINRGS